MDATRMLAEARGFFTRGEAIELGFDDDDLAASLRQGVLVRIRRGTYSRDLWASYDELERYRVRCRAVLHVLGPRVALSHTSGAIVHGMACWGADLGTVHVTRLDGGAGRIEAGVQHHVGRAVDGDVLEVGGMSVLAADRCAIEAASRVPGHERTGADDPGLLPLPAARRPRRPDAPLRADGPLARHPQAARPRADGGRRRGEPGRESRSVALPAPASPGAPVLQYPVFDAQGRLVGRTDWAWPEYGLLGEFDGRIKYGRLLLPGQDPGEVVFSEKIREDELREITAYGMVRLTWTDYDRPRQTDARIRRLLRIAA